MIYLIAAVFVFLLDYRIKKWAEENLKDGKRRKIGKTGCSLQLVHNKGFAMNRMEDRPKLVTILHGVMVFLLFLYGILFLFFEKGREWTSFGYALILGGGLSNFYDRVKKGYVTDYLGLPVLKKLLFNLSDLMVFLGGLIVLLAEWKHS